MMNATLTIIHDRKRKAVGTNKEAVLEVRVTRHRRSIHVSTGIKVRHSEWVAGRVVGRLDAQVLNDQLAIIYNKVGSDSRLMPTLSSTRCGRWPRSAPIKKRSSSGARRRYPC